MNVYVVASGRRIAPFGDPVLETPIDNKPLSYWQARAFKKAKLVPIDVETTPRLVVPDTLFCSGVLLRRFVDEAAGRDAVLVLKESVFGRDTTSLQSAVTKVDAGWRFEEIRMVSGRGEAPIEIVVDPEETVDEFPAPIYLQNVDALQLSRAKYPLMTLQHWVHTLIANQAVRHMMMGEVPLWRLVLLGLGALLRARSFNKWKLFGKINTIGRKCDIHPTAVVEGCTIGDNVTIGAFAFVQLSNIADGVTIMPGAQVTLSTLGERATVSEQVVLRFCVLYPEAVASQYLMQMCILGRRAVTTGGAFSIDLNFASDIRVRHDGKLQTSGTRFLGSAFGHECRVGTGFWLAAGREVPNHAFLIRDPEHVLARVPAQVTTEEPLVVRGKGLLPLSEI